MREKKEWGSTKVGDLSAAIGEFEAALPGWWWSIGLPGWWWSISSCSLARHANCGGDRYAVDGDGLLQFKLFWGFHCYDWSGTVSNSLRDVMQQALNAGAEAIAKYPNVLDGAPIAKRGNCQSLFDIGAWTF